MKKLTFKDLIEKIQLVVVRFTFPIFFILGICFMFFVVINNEKADIDQYLWVFFGLSIPLSLATSLLAEEFNKKIVGVALNIVATIILLFYALALPDDLISVNIYQIFVLGIVFVLLSFVISFYKKNTDISFWEFSKTSILQLIISSIFAQVLMLGLFLAVLSLKELFKLDIDEKVYANIGVICYGIFAPVYFLSNIPNKVEKHKQEFKFDKFLKILGLYILLPILALYSVILYVYLFQIIGKWELPEGWVTWLVSVLALGGFLCMLVVYPLQLQLNKIANLFSKYFPVFLLPLLLLMTVGIFRRFDDYGLTINRAYVFLLNFWLIGSSIYLFITKSKHLKWIVVSFAIIAFLSAVGPWSVLNVTKKNMITEVENLLSTHNYLKDGKVVDSTEIAKIKIDSKTEQLLASKVVYICNNFGIENLQVYFNKPMKNAFSITNYLGIEQDDNSLMKTNFFSANLKNDDKEIDIIGYSSFLSINKNYGDDELFENKTYKVTINEGLLQINNLKTSAKTSINLNSKLIELKDAQDQLYPLAEMTIKGENYKLIITNVSGERKSKNKTNINQLEAILLLK